MSSRPDHESVTATVGRNVRTLRRQQRMTIDALAAAAGVSRGTVIQIESVRANPSIGTLVALATALRVGVASLVVDEDQEPRVVVRRGGDAQQLWSSPAGSSAVFRIATDPPDVVELWDWTLAAGDAFDGRDHTVGTQEVLSVLEGRLGLSTGSTDVEIGPGDTLMFAAHARRRYYCAGDSPVRFTMVVLRFGDAGLIPPTSIAPVDPDG